MQQLKHRMLVLSRVYVKRLRAEIPEGPSWVRCRLGTGCTTTYRMQERWTEEMHTQVTHGRLWIISLVSPQVQAPHSLVHLLDTNFRFTPEKIMAGPGLLTEPLQSLIEARLFQSFCLYIGTGMLSWGKGDQSASSLPVHQLFLMPRCATSLDKQC